MPAVAASPAPPGALRVLGLGDPVTDIVAVVSHDFLATLTDEPGGCLSVEGDAMAKLLAATEAAGYALQRMPGGSAANVMKGLANLLPRSELQASFLGMVANDRTGAEYCKGLAAQGVTPLLLTSSSGAPSAIALCLVTPDGQRTMRTCLGASLELSTFGMVPQGWAEGLRLLHCEGYCLYRAALAKQMMQAAHAAGAQVSLDLASFELVRNCWRTLMALLEGGCVDIVFCNHEEATQLAREMQMAQKDADHDTLVAAAQAFLLRHVRMCVISEGPRGCRIADASGGAARAPADDVKVVDTIGAGDAFSSGVLAAMLRGAPLAACARLGCDVGAAVVTVAGAQLPARRWSQLRAKAGALLPPHREAQQGPVAALHTWARQLWHTACGGGMPSARPPSGPLLACALPLSVLGAALLLAMRVRALKAA